MPDPMKVAEYLNLRPIPNLLVVCQVIIEKAAADQFTQHVLKHDVYDPPLCIWLVQGNVPLGMVNMRMGNYPGVPIGVCLLKAYSYYRTYLVNQSFCGNFLIYNLET